MALDDNVRNTINRFYEDVSKVRQLDYERREKSNTTYEHIKDMVKGITKEYQSKLPPIEREHLERLKKSYFGEPEKDPLAIKVSEMGFSNRALNALDRGGFTELEDLTQSSYEELQKFPGMGKKTLEEVRQKVHESGYQFRDE